MSKQHKKLKIPPQDNLEIKLKPYQQTFLGLLWVAAVIVVIIKAAQNEHGTWATGLLGLGVLWLIICCFATLVGLLEIFMESFLRLPTLRHRSITSGNGIRGVIGFCIGAIYMVTVLIALVMLFVTPKH